MDKTCDVAVKGRNVWLRIKREYEIDYKDLVIFCEYHDDQMLRLVYDDIEKTNKNNVFIISYTDVIAADGVTIIRLNEREYESLRSYYILTVFSPNIRVITDREPF